MIKVGSDPTHHQDGDWFNKNKTLLDPYAKSVAGRDVWGKTPLKDLVIYEMHVRGFTHHESSGVNYPGTFAGIIEKIPYLKRK